MTNDRYNLQSGCSHLETNNKWQSNSLIVSPVTNHYETRCYSTHLIKFFDGFIVSPAPVNWIYVFTNTSLIQNKTVYSTVICVAAIYLLLIIYTRFKDDTQIRTFACPNQTILLRDEIDLRMIKLISRSLKLLNYIGIWHNHTGLDTSASWFLNYLIVQDLQTIEKFPFIGQRWLTTGKSNIEKNESFPMDYRKKHIMKSPKVICA